MTTVGEITAAIAAHKKAGEILNPTYQDLSGQARRIFGSDTNHARDLMLKHFHAGDKTEELNTLYYDWPSDSFMSLGKAERALAKVKGDKYKDVISAATEVIKKWKPIAADLKDLKGKVVKVTQKRAEAKTAAAAVMQSKFNDSASLIKVLESHLKEYKDMAAKRAGDFLKDKLATLKDAGWDLNKVAPPPNSSNMDRERYMTAQNKRSLYTSITKAKDSSSRRGEPDIREPNQVMIDHYINQAVKGAEESYRDFMQKMINKIGKPVTDAVMTGSIWTNASLKVTTSDGENQTWNTKMILNFSKYQKMFNQFPSRKLK
jgi:hypothetical protein